MSIIPSLGGFNPSFAKTDTCIRKDEFIGGVTDSSRVAALNEIHVSVLNADPFLNCIV